jgi:hypothetical protein
MKEATTGTTKITLYFRVLHIVLEINEALNASD